MFHTQHHTFLVRIPNMIFPKYNGHRKPNRLSRHEMVLATAAKAPPARDFAVAAFSLDIDTNIQVIYRNLACFNGKEMFIIGSRKWFRGATNGLENFIPITYCKTPTAFIQQSRAAGYALVSVELSESAVDVADAIYPKKPCFILGNETYGVTGDVIHRSDLVVQIPMNGVHPCLNVAVTSGIIMHDYLTKAG